MTENRASPIERWRRKFQCAFRGLWLGMKGQNSFLVHFPFAIAALALGWVVRCNLLEFCLLILCIGVVFACEYFNSAMEQLAKGVCKETNHQVGAALDIASAAVLVASLAAVVVGVLLLLPRLWMFVFSH